MKFIEKLIIFIIGIATGILGLLGGVWYSEECNKHGWILKSKKSNGDWWLK